MSKKKLEPAIPPHLQCPRTVPKRMPAGFEPRFPCSVARFNPNVKQVVMAYFGLQHSSETAYEEDVTAALDNLVKQFKAKHGPGHYDISRGTDLENYTTYVIAAYWDDPQSFEDWFNADNFQNWWQDPDRLRENVGYFYEIITPHIETYATIYDDPKRPVGMAKLSDSMSGPVQEHDYWGSLRDRMAATQTETLAASGKPRANISKGTFGNRVTIEPHEGIAMIRESIDLSQVAPDELALYQKTLAPPLMKAMDFLSGDGLDVGCFSNLYLDIIDDKADLTKKHFSLSWWYGLKELEKWAESHPTHLAIYGPVLEYEGNLGRHADVSVVHDVAVAHAHEQRFEYINCHPKTGMLRAL